MASSIEELAFELIEEHTTGDLEKLVKFLDLLINGKKTVEARDDSGKAAVASTPASRGSSSKAKSTKASGTSDPSSDDDDPDAF